MKRHLLSASILAAFAIQSANATIAINLQTDSVKTALGGLLPENSLAFLIASTVDSNFSQIEGGTMFSAAAVAAGTALIGGTDDYIIGIIPNNINARVGPGIIDVSFSSSGEGALSLGVPPTFTSGDRLAVVWFDGVAANATMIPEGAKYGLYTSSSVVDFSSPWVAPADGGSINLAFLTTDGAFFGPGSNAPSAGNASLTTTAIPEPATLVFGSFVLMAGLTARQRRRG